MIHANITVESLLAAGGKLWERNGSKRVYFNNLIQYTTLKVRRYDSGNVFSATHEGAKISNGQARDMLLILDFAKVWYDCTENKFRGQETKGWLGEITVGIKARIAQSENVSEVA